MKKVKIILAAALSMAVVFGAAIPANAASTEVTIEVKETAMDNVSVTVPTLLPIVFNEDGTNTFPTNWSIKNISTIAGIHLEKIEMDGSATGWNLLTETADTKSMAVNTKSIIFSVGKAGELKVVEPTTGAEAAKGSVEFQADEMTIASGEEQVLGFDVKRGAFSENEASDKAFDMVLTFAFN